MKRFLNTTTAIVILFLTFFVSCKPVSSLGNYKGIPYTDTAYKKGIQTLPGKLHCEFYDFGGEGIAYHDSDTINSGSGNLNKIDGSYLHGFRVNEPVDISFTKPNDIDDNDYNMVDPKMEQLYLGWTNPGEWTKYTINVKTTGRYKIGVMYTANLDGQISIAINDSDVTGALNIKSTYSKEDPVAWRQWHHWNYIDGLAEIELKKGLQTLTLHTVAKGEMNYDYLNFSLIKE